jgi:hypothetical protein
MHPSGTGGAVMVANGADALVFDCSFSSAVAYLGGAIAVTSSSAVTTLSVTGSTFTGCSSSFGGGAIVLKGGGAAASAAKAVVTGSVFSGNQVTTMSASGGGAILVSSADDQLDAANCSFNGNSAVTGGAIQGSDGAKLTVAASAFKGNGYLTLDGGAAVYGGCCASVAISRSSFLGAFQAAGTLLFECALHASSVAVDACLFDSTRLPEESAGDYSGSQHVTVRASGVAAAVTRSAFLGADAAGLFTHVLAKVGAAWSVRQRVGGPSWGMSLLTPSAERARRQALTAGGNPALAPGLSNAHTCQAGATLSVRQSLFAGNEGTASPVGGGSASARAQDAGTKLNVLSSTFIGNKRASGASAGVTLTCSAGAAGLRCGCSGTQPAARRKQRFAPGFAQPRSQSRPCAAGCRPDDA